MKYQPTNTLAYWNGAPQSHRHDLSELPTAVFAAATKKYRATCGTTSPNDEAVTFYTLNHAASIVRQIFTDHEPLPEWADKIMASYTDVTMAQGERMLHYILSISTREMRHLKHPTAAFWAKIEKLFGSNSVALLQDIKSNGDEMIAVKKYMDLPPAMSIGQYVKTLSYGFHHGGKSAGWAGSYGGPPWGETTDAAVAMIHGVTSMEQLVDTGYTLAHNGGPIFDKGMMYSHYDGHLITVLDVQRSGQMLDLIDSSNTNGVKKTPQAVAAVELLKIHYPENEHGEPTFQGFVDWKMVADLRTAKQKQDEPNKYGSLIADQKKQSTKKVIVLDPKSPLATTLLVHGKKVKITGTWQVFPHQSVTTYERMDD